LSSTGPVSAQTLTGAQTPFSSIDVSSIGLPSLSHFGAVLADNEHIYFLPRSADNILELNPETGALNTIDISQHATTYLATRSFQLGEGSNKYAGGVLAPDGHIYLVPFNAKGILDFDPASGTSSMIYISGTSSGCPQDFPYQSSVLTEACYNTMGYAAAGVGPCGSWCTRDVTICGGNCGCGANSGFVCSDTSKYVQGVLAPNGHIYMCPHTVSYVCVFLDIERRTLPFWV
jgi:hypothetical protein